MRSALKRMIWYKMGWQEKNQCIFMGFDGQKQAKKEVNNWRVLLVKYFINVEIEHTNSNNLHRKQSY